MFASSFAADLQFFRNKWYFDEMYNAFFVRPALFLARAAATVDHGASTGWPTVRRGRCWRCRRPTIGSTGCLSTALVNLTARWTFAVGLWLRRLQTGNLRQYVMFIVVGLVALFVLIVYWNYAVAGW